MKIFKGSLAAFLLIGGLLLYAPPGQAATLHGLWHNPGIMALSVLVARIMGGTFPIICFGSWLAVIASGLGYGFADPITRELREHIHWDRRVNHDRSIDKAIKKDLTYVGYDVTFKDPVFLNAGERNTHVHVVGSTGSGKTRFVLFPMMRQDIRAGRGVLFVDAKGSLENAKVVYQMVREAGREKDFLLFSLTHPENSCTYNPLQHGNASQLKDKITAAIDWSEPFYQRTCENALQTLFMDLDRMKKRVTLRELAGYLKDPPQLPGFDIVAKRNKDNIETLCSEAELLVNTPFGALLDAHNAEIDLLKAYKERKIVYFALDTQSYQQTAMRLGKMITQDINTLSGIVESRFPKAERRPLAVYIDEYQAFGTKGFINALARGRESGLWITIAHQSIGDLQTIDEAYAAQIAQLTNTKIFLRANDPETAQLFADSVGTAKTLETTKQIHMSGEVPKGTMGSQKVVHEYLIHPSELKVLEPGRAMFKSGGRFGRLLLPGHFPDVEGIQLPEKLRKEPVPAPIEKARVPKPELSMHLPRKR